MSGDKTAATTKLIFAPTVVVLGRMEQDRRGIDDWANLYGAEHWHAETRTGGDILPEVAGRSCYGSFANPRPGGNAAYIGHVIQAGHTSVLEHAVWTIGIAGISRSCSHQLVRHRVGMSPSQLSQRFVSLVGSSYVVPPALCDAVAAARKHCDECGSSPIACYVTCWHIDSLGRDVSATVRAGLAWLGAIESSADWHGNLLADMRAMQPAVMQVSTHGKKIVNETVRSISTEAAETRIVFTGNARAWRHMLTLRGTGDADAEIRRLMVALAGVLKEEAPNVFADVSVHADGTVSVGDSAERAESNALLLEAALDVLADLGTHTPSMKSLARLRDACAAVRGGEGGAP